MTYKVNGRKVTKEEWDALPKGKPIEPGDRLTILGAQAFDSFVSPIDGQVISSKSKLKDHNKMHDVVQVGNDLKNKGCEGRTREESINKQKGTTNGD